MKKDAGGLQQKVKNSESTFGETQRHAVVANHVFGREDVQQAEEPWLW